MPFTEAKRLEDLTAAGLAALGADTLLYIVLHPGTTALTRSVALSVLTSYVGSAYVPLTQKGAANGVATLDSGGLIPGAQLPPLALGETFTVASQAAMLALVAQRGDMAIRTDLDPDGFFLLTSDSPGTLADWKQILAPGSVVSVDGRTGAVTLGDLYQAISADLTDLVARWVVASAAGPASLAFAEDADNGTSVVTLAAPASLAADRAVTLPDVAGVLALLSQVVKPINGGEETVQAHGNTGATETIDVANGNVHTAAQDQACVYTFTNPASATAACSFTLILTSVTGAATWPASVNWPAGTAPTLTGRCVLTFVTVNGGTDWDGFLAGSGLA